MAVLLLKETQHVLAAATQPPDGAPPTPEALVGSAFPLRLRMAADIKSRPPVLFLLPAAALEAELLPLDPRVLAQPLAFAVNGGTAGLLHDAPVPTTALKELTFDVTFTNEPGERKTVTAVRGLDPDYPEQRLQTASFEAGKKELKLGLKLSPDGPEAGLEKNRECAVMVAIAGLRLACFAKTVS